MTTKITKTGGVSADYLVDILRRDLQLPRGADLTLTVRIPSGGDYSSMNIDVDDDMIRYEATWVEK